MYERFTDRGRKIMQLANQEAQKLNEDYVGTEHILLGLALEGSGIAANVLKTLDITADKISNEIRKRTQKGFNTIAGKLPLTPRAKKVIEYSIEEAKNLNHNYIGTEHLLLALMREEGGIAFDILSELLPRIDIIREETLNLLGFGEHINKEASSEPGEIRFHKFQLQAKVVDGKIEEMKNMPTIDELIDIKLLAFKSELLEEIKNIIKGAKSE